MYKDMGVHLLAMVSVHPTMSERVSLVMSWILPILCILYVLAWHGVSTSPLIARFGNLIHTNPLCHHTAPATTTQQRTTVAGE